MENKLIIKKHSNGLVSIKDKDNNVNISDEKWKFIFDSLISKNWLIYFKGWRFDFSYEVEARKNVNNIIEKISDVTFLNKDEGQKLFFKIKVFDKDSIKLLWEYFEYPSILFIEKELKKDRIESNFNDKINKVIEFDSKFCCLYKMDPETDVLWIEKSNEIVFSYFEEKI